MKIVNRCLCSFETKIPEAFLTPYVLNPEDSLHISEEFLVLALPVPPTFI